MGTTQFTVRKERKCQNNAHAAAYTARRLYLSHEATPEVYPMPCMPRRILLFAGLFSGSSGVAPSAGHCRPPPTTPPQPTPARRPGSATPAATGVCSAERTNKSRPISPSLRTRHEIIPSRAGDGRHSKPVCTVHCPHPAKSRFMLRGSAARGWPRRCRFHDSPLANQATFHNRKTLH